MFSTFRQRKSAAGHDEYILESTATQLKRPIPRISRLACVYCRSKKIKCTGEEHGCQRCLDKRIVCSYINSARAEAGSVGTTSPSLQRPAEEVTALQNDVENPTDADSQLGWDHIMNSSDLLHIDANLGPFGTDQVTYNTFDPSDSSPFGGFQTLGNVDSATATSSSVSEHTKLDMSGCKYLCSKMLEIYEIAEIGLAQVQRPELIDVPRYHTMSSSQSQRKSIDKLWWQKEVLKSCELWLSRDAAQIKSHHAMLMVSIFDRLLVSVFFIAASPGERDGSHALRYSESPVRRASYIGAEERSCQDADHALDSFDEDDEETRHVMKSLLTFRMSRLKGLLERLSAIAASNQWPTQTVMVQDMLERLSKQVEFR